MKKDENMASLLLNLNCNYEHCILGYYDATLALHLNREFEPYKNLSYPIVIKGNMKQKGSKFLVRRPDLGVLMFYKVEEIMITDYYSRFKYLIYKTIPKTFIYTHLVEIRYINENQCDLRASLYFDEYILSESEFKELLNHMIKLHRSIELSLRTYIARKLSNIFTVINCNIELIFNILRNLKMVNKYVHFFGNKINYDGEVLKKNNNIQIQYKNKFKYIANVNRCKISNKKDFTKQCIIELLFKKDDQKKIKEMIEKLIC